MLHLLFILWAFFPAFASTAQAAVVKTEVNVSVAQSGFQMEDETNLKDEGVRAAMREFMEENCVDPADPKVAKFLKKTATYAKQVRVLHSTVQGDRMQGKLMVYLKQDNLAKDMKRKKLGRWGAGCAEVSGLKKKSIFVLQGGWAETESHDIEVLLRNSRVNFSAIQDSIRDHIIKVLKNGGFSLHAIHRDPKYRSLKKSPSDPLLGYYWVEDTDEFGSNRSLIDNMMVNQPLIDAVRAQKGLVTYFKIRGLRRLSDRVVAKIGFETENSADLTDQPETIWGEYAATPEENTPDGWGLAVEAAIRNAAEVALRNYSRFLREYLESISG